MNCELFHCISFFCFFGGWGGGVVPCNVNLFMYANIYKNNDGMALSDHPPSILKKSTKNRFFQLFSKYILSYRKFIVESDGGILFYQKVKLLKIMMFF